jgi:hypothetical protein
MIAKGEGKIENYPKVIDEIYKLIELNKKQLQNYHKLILSCEREMWALSPTFYLETLSRDDKVKEWKKHKELWKNAGITPYPFESHYPLLHAVKEWINWEKKAWMNLQKKKFPDHDPNNSECKCGDCEKDQFPSRYEN